MFAARVRRIWRRFRGDRGGNAAMLFGLAALTVVLMIGAGIDYSRASLGRTALGASADAAALRAALLLTEGSVTALRVEEDTRAAVITEFQRNIAGVGEPEVDLSIEAEAVTVSATAKVPTTFMMLIGVDAIDVAATSTSSLGAREALDFHILLDTSDSMGLAADGAARAKLRAATVNAPIAWRRSCEFACHVTEDASLEPQTRLQLARALDVPIRLDAAKNGIRLFMDLAARKAGRIDSRFSLSVFNTDLHAVVPLTSDRFALSAGLAPVDIAYGRTGPNAFGDTFFNQIGTNYTNIIRGYSNAVLPKATRTPTIVLVGDGVRSGWEQTLGNGGIAPFDQSVCNGFKAAGFQVAVIYTKYYPIPTEPFYNDNVAPIIDQIEPNMRACASDASMFAAADTPDEIDAAFEQIFRQVEHRIRIMR